VSTNIPLPVIRHGTCIGRQVLITGHIKGRVNEMLSCALHTVQCDLCRPAFRSHQLIMVAPRAAGRRNIVAVATVTGHAGSFLRSRNSNDLVPGRVEWRSSHSRRRSTAYGGKKTHKKIVAPKTSLKLWQNINSNCFTRRIIKYYYVASLGHSEIGIAFDCFLFCCHFRVRHAHQNKILKQFLLVFTFPATLKQYRSSERNQQIE